MSNPRKPWRGENSIPLKFPQDIYFRRYLNGNCMEYCLSIPLNLVSFENYKLNHPEELAEYLKKYDSTPRLFLMIHELPWNPELHYGFVKTYPHISKSVLRFSPPLSGSRERWEKDNDTKRYIQKIHIPRRLLENTFNVQLKPKPLGTNVVTDKEKEPIYNKPNPGLLDLIYSNPQSRLYNFYWDLMRSYFACNHNVWLKMAMSWVIPLALGIHHRTLIPGTW